jgi:membrane protease YdiL (CAAX protease family)
VRKHIALFVAGVTVVAWAANYAASIIGAGDPAMASVGMSLGALGPLLMAALIRRLSGQGWKNAGLSPRMAQSGHWYIFALLYTPALIGLIGLAAVSFGLAELAATSAPALHALLKILGITLGPMLFLSVSEEFGWRGYLEPALLAVNRNSLLNHIFVGFVWGTWHFPVLVFAPGNTTTPLQLVMVVLGCVALAIIYGQMRLRSGTVWPCVVLHAVSNSAFVAVGSAGLLEFDPGTAVFVSLSSTSLAIVAAWWMTGLFVFARAPRN